MSVQKIGKARNKDPAQTPRRLLAQAFSVRLSQDNHVRFAAAAMAAVGRERTIEKA